MNHALDPATVKTEAMTQNLAAIFKDLFKSNRRTRYPPRSTPPGTKRAIDTKLIQLKNLLQTHSLFTFSTKPIVGERVVGQFNGGWARALIGILAVSVFIDKTLGSNMSSKNSYTSK